MSKEQGFCSFNKCKNKATLCLSNNINDDSISLCKTCNIKYQEHLEARENMFKEQGKAEALKEFEKIIDEAIIIEDNCLHFIVSRQNLLMTDEKGTLSCNPSGKGEVALYQYQNSLHKDKTADTLRGKEKK